MSNIYANNINPRSGDTVTFPQNIKVLGTATYEDVANVDSVGIITAQSGINVTGGSVGIGTDNPESTSQLHIKNTSGNAKITLETNETNDSYINFSGATAEASIGYEPTSNSVIISNSADGLISNEVLRIESGNTIHIGKRDGNQNVTHFGTSRVSICGPDPIATSVSKAGSYLAIGNNESELNGVYPITFGYTNNTNSHQPAYIAYKTINAGGSEYGDLLFGTRNVTSDTEPTERVRITSAGNVGIGTDDPSYALVVGSGTDDALSVDTLSTNNGVVLRSFDAGKTDYKPLGLAAQYINFYTRTGANSSSERMRINSGLPTLQVGKNGATNTTNITANTNLIADFGRANINGDIASISVGTGTYRIFSGKVPAIFNQAQSTLTATFRFASSYGVAVIEMDTVGGLAQVSVGRYLMIVDCDTSNGQTAQLTGGSSIQTVLASGYGSPTFTASGASATPTFTVSWTRSGSVGSENWSNYWQFTARISNNSPASPCELISLTMS